MKFASIVLAAICGQTLATDSYKPIRVDYDLLINKASDTTLLDALQSVGMVSVTNMPEQYRSNKREALSLLHSCAMESESMASHVFPDGTHRRTMATHTIPGPGGMQSMVHGDSKVCQEFDQKAKQVRQGIDTVTRAFANTLNVLLKDSMGSAPLLETQDGFRFENVEDIVENGEHLEHFHSYQAPSIRKSVSTIEWHTDQGMFLVFTPGVFADKGLFDLETTEGFYIELADGSKTLVEFDSEDDAVILLGDGINQYVNTGLKSNARRLRSVPHALTMPSRGESAVRTWYGRMVLPPVSAVHPLHGETFGELRRLLIEASVGEDKDSKIMSLGCSEEMAHARQLEETSCEEGSTRCWHRCMVHAEYGVSEAICADRNLDLRCMNPRGQLWDNTHGDWYPGCIDADTAPMGTPYPTLPEYPRSEEECTKEGYEAYVEEKSQDYEFKANLLEGGYFLWSVEGDNIKGMLANDGLLGYSSVGFTGILPEGNAMYGATVMMLKPSGEYNPVTGFNLSLAPVVEDHVLSTKATTFRLWSTPVESEFSPQYSFDETPCFTSLMFNTPGIYNRTFNIEGSDVLIWGANGKDFFGGYHGRSRGEFTVEWKTGSVTLDPLREEILANLTKAKAEEGGDGTTEPEDTSSVGDDTSSSGIAGLSFGAVLVSLAGLLI